MCVDLLEKTFDRHIADAPVNKGRQGCQEDRGRRKPKWEPAPGGAAGWHGRNDERSCDYDSPAGRGAVKATPHVRDSTFRLVFEQR